MTSIALSRMIPHLNDCMTSLPISQNPSSNSYMLAASSSNRTKMTLLRPMKIKTCCVYISISCSTDGSSAQKNPKRSLFNFSSLSGLYLTHVRAPGLMDEDTRPSSTGTQTISCPRQQHQLLGLLTSAPALTRRDQLHLQPIQRFPKPFL